MAARSAGAMVGEGLRGQGAAESRCAAHPVAMAQLSQSPARGTTLGEPPFPDVSADRASVLLSGNSLSDLPATKPEPSWQGWFSTQVWQLMSEQCVPARHWHTVLCVAFPFTFSMRPASGQREHGQGVTASRGASPPRLGSVLAGSTYCLHRFHEEDTASPWSSLADSARSHRGHRQSLLFHCTQRSVFPLQQRLVKKGQGGIPSFQTAPLPAGQGKAGSCGCQDCCTILHGSQG